MFSWRFWLTPALSGNPHSPPQPCLIRVSKKRKGAQKPILALLVGTQASYPEIGSHLSLHLSAQLMFTLGPSPPCGGHIIISCLQPIKSPCFSSGGILSPRSLEPENPHCELFYSINILLHFFNLARSGLLCWHRSVSLCGGAENLFLNISRKVYF